MLPYHGEGTAVSRGGRAADCALSHHGETLLPASRVARLNARFPIMGKALPPASRVTQLNARPPMGKAMPPEAVTACRDSRAAHRARSHVKKVALLTWAVLEVAR